MRRIRASASAVAVEIGMSREAVNNWRRGYSLPNKKSKDKVLACAAYLRLSAQEKASLLLAAGFETDGCSGKDEMTSIWQQSLIRLRDMKPYPILLLLSQAHTDLKLNKDLLVSLADVDDTNEQVIHLQILYSSSATQNDYFSYLGKQLGLPDIEDDLSFEFALGDLLKRHKLVLIINRFEKGNKTHSEMLAGVLRNLVEMHPENLLLIISGGEHLSSLKYANGDHSLLNIADNYLVDPGIDQLISGYSPKLDGISEQQLAMIEKASGAHPGLVREQLDYLRKNPNASLNELIELVLENDQLYCDFNLVYQHTDTEPLARYLTQRDLGKYRPYLPDKTLRKLFWQNLIKKTKDNHLVWRSETIRSFGVQFIKERQN